MSSTITRTGVLRRLGLALGGLVGLAAGGTAATQLTAGGQQTGRAPTTLTLYAHDVRIGRAASVPNAGAAGRRQRAQSAKLLDERQAPIGTFSGIPLADGGTQLHTFNLADGAIFGLAVSGALGAAHAIVGGTGRYAGATGTYHARPADAQSGNQTELKLTLTAWEV